MMRKHFCSKSKLALFSLLTLTFLFCGCFSCNSVNGDDDDNDDENDEAYCDIDEENLSEVPFSAFQTDCPKNLGMNLSLEKVLADDTLTIIEARGSYSINNDNSYFLRGDGLGDALCFDKIENAGSYAVRTQNLECAKKVSFHVVTSTDPSAVPLCSLSFTVDVSCDDDDDDDTGDDDDDDDTGDDDTGDDDTGDDDIDDDDTGDDDTGDDDIDDDDTGDDDTMDDDTADDDTADDDTADDDTVGDIFEEDFESYTNGPLGSPWYEIFQGGISTHTVVALKAGSGKVMLQTGGTTAADYIGSELDFTNTAADLQVDFDVWIESGAEFGFRIYSYDDTFGQYFDEVQLSYDDTTGLRAVDWSLPDYVNCDSITSETWSTFTIDIDFDDGEFDLLINGSLTSCNGLGMHWADGNPMGSLSVIDWSDDGYGGIVKFDNIRGH